jgi:hypothetical protein
VLNAENRGGIEMTNEYRKVNRKAEIGEKVLITNKTYDSYGSIFTVEGYDEDDDLSFVGDDRYYASHGSYAVLEPVGQPQESLTLTEADVRNNPRQVIDLIANLAGRLTKLESKVERLGDSTEQAISTVARNVETWAQETERIKHVMESPAPWAEDSFVIELSKKVSEIDAKLSAVDDRTQPYQQAHELFVKIAGGMNGRGLTAEERREL